MYPADARGAGSLQIHLAGVVQPARAPHELSQHQCFPAEGMFLLKGQKNTLLTEEHEFHLCLHTRNTKSGCLTAQSSPSPQSSPS